MKAAKRKDKLMTNKRNRQARSRALVQSGQRTQESMFFIAPAIARAAKVEHRAFSFDFDDEDGAQ